MEEKRMFTEVPEATFCLELALLLLQRALQDD